MLDRLTSMSAFVAAVDTGSMTAAAKMLGMSQPMVAKHLVSLEARTGVRLLNRTTRSQSVTEAGRTYYERCRLILTEVEAADELTAEFRGQPRGRLRITAPIVFGRHQLMPLVTDFLTTYPDVDVDVVLTDRFVDLVEEGFEASFRIGNLPDSAMIARPLAPIRLLLTASPTYLRARGTPADPADLASHECLSYATRARTGEARWTLSQGDKVAQVRVKRRLEINETQALLAAAVGGFGILAAPEIVVRDALASGALVEVLPTFSAPSNPLHLIYPADRRQTPKLKRFIEASLKAFA